MSVPNALLPAHTGLSEEGKGAVCETQLGKLRWDLQALTWPTGAPASPLCRAEDQSCKQSRKQKTGSKPIWLRGSDTKVLLHNLSPEVFWGREARGFRQSLFWGGRDPPPFWE